MQSFARTAKRHLDREANLLVRRRHFRVRLKRLRGMKLVQHSLLLDVRQHFGDKVFHGGGRHGLSGCGQKLLLDRVPGFAEPHALFRVPPRLDCRLAYAGVTPT